MHTQEHLTAALLQTLLYTLKLWYFNKVQLVKVYLGNVMH